MDATTTTIDAVYSGGMLRPLGEVKLAENEQVRLTITRQRKYTQQEVEEWMKRTAKLRQEQFEEHGYLPDSTELIRACRYGGTDQ